MSASDLSLTVIIVSYNTRELTLKAIQTLFETTKTTPFHVVVYDNASSDGSADAVEEAYPQVELIRSQENIGFARANNIVAETAETEYLLLLNPDTECHEDAVDRLFAFAQANPEAGIWGGRTVFPDGSLNIASCWKKITLWSAFCRTFWLDAIFSKSEFFNPEAMGDWQRDTVRHVDIVVGCFLMIRTELWHQLGGFDLKYFMYGEEADMCLRAAKMGYRPMITPDAQIMHLVGAAAGQRSGKWESVARARTTLIRDHLPQWQVPIGLGLMWIWAALRRVLTALRGGDKSEIYAHVWARRKVWLKGY